MCENELAMDRIVQGEAGNVDRPVAHNPPISTRTR